MIEGFSAGPTCLAMPQNRDKVTGLPLLPENILMSKEVPALVQRLQDGEVTQIYLYD